jgi:glycine C-acetyltransferase
MADIFERLVKNFGPLGQHRERAHGYFAFPKLEGDIGTHMKFRGKEMIVWSLNNYLGFGQPSMVRKADTDATAEFGLAYPMGARMMSGNSNYHEQLERELAEFEHKEDSILLNYGYQGIMSAIDAICGRHDVVVYDSECHACIIDGLRLHPGHRYVYKHNDVEDCEKQLQRATSLLEKQGSGGILVITEGVFGMAGDQGKVKEIAELKENMNSAFWWTMRMVLEPLAKPVPVPAKRRVVRTRLICTFSTFAKSMASIGAFIAGPKMIIDYIRYNIRSQIFAKSLPMPIVIGNLKRLEMLAHHARIERKALGKCAEAAKRFERAWF